MASTDEASASEQRWLSGSVQKDGARDLLSGMISGFFCKVLEYPFDTIKVLEQTGGAKFSGPLDAEVRADGLYQGGIRVVGAQGGAIMSPSGGGLVDAESRAAIDAILAMLRLHGMIAES